MVSLDSFEALPFSDSSNLTLSHPTPEECASIWKLSFSEWGDALTLADYLEESNFLTSVPLARDGGMTIWILVDKYLPPNRRPILCSCETFRKQSFVAQNGVISNKIIHGVASVFCNPAYRRHGYASRLMVELAKILRSWQTETGECVGSFLYSDIGKKFYDAHGWHPFPDNNMHIELQAQAPMEDLGVKALAAQDLAPLCKEDHEMIRRGMTSGMMESRIRMMLVPDHDHMLWHHTKEEFVCDKLFGKRPTVKGAMAGSPGSRIWAIWTHRFYGDPQSASSGNTLYILRLVIEDEDALNDVPSRRGESLSSTRRTEILADQLKAVLQFAQAEAAKWSLNHVIFWHPTRLACDLIERTGLNYRLIVRDYEGIASLLWYGEEKEKEGTLQWMSNEKFAWC